MTLSGANGVSSTVGLLGVGAIGRGFAKNLVAAGFTVKGFDLRASAMTELRSFGGLPVQTPAAAAKDAAWLVTSLPGHDHVVDALFGADGAAPGLTPSALVIDTSTSLPEESIRLGQQLGQEGLRFVDASVSGTGATVLDRDVTMLVGGSNEDYQASLPVLNAIARSSYHLGPVGSGALAKLLINVVVVGNRLALAESLALGIKAGVEPHTLLQILKDGPAYSRAMDLKGEKMISGDFRPESTLAQSLHGTEMLLAESRRVGSPLFGVAIYSQVAQAAVSLGLGDLDPAALLEAIQIMGGVKGRD